MRGNEEEVIRWVAPLKDKLFRFALTRVNNRMDAEDIVQEVWLRTWNQISSGKQIENIEAWCMRLVRNLSIDSIRKTSTRRTVDIEASATIASVHPSPQKITEYRDIIKQIDDKMNELPALQREILHLREIEGMKYDEIAEILEMNMQQVKTHIHRARQVMRKHLNQIDSYGL